MGNLLGSNIIFVPAIVTVAYFASRNTGDQKNCVEVKQEALDVQTIPYILIIILAAVLTVPHAWRGLQPIDGWIMLAAYVVYMVQAILRERESSKEVHWQKDELFKDLTKIEKA